MALLKRFGYYTLGVVLGSVLVIVFFGDRDLQCSYFPNDRVLSDLRKKEMNFSAEAQCKWNCYSLDSAAYHHIFNNGQIDFSKSQTKGTRPKVYYIESGKFTPIFSIEVENRDSSATVIDFSAVTESSRDCDC